MGELLLGRTQVYTGNGKGKTTAALGLALRAYGQGLKVFILQFMKGSPDYGEVKALRKLSPAVALIQTGRKSFVDPKNPAEADIKEARRGLLLAHEALISGKYDVVILDEINVAVSFGLLGVDDVLKLMEERPPAVELVLTGRYAKEEVIDKADLVTEMVPIKHYFDTGTKARKGIEQ